MYQPIVDHFRENDAVMYRQLLKSISSLSELQKPKSSEYLKELCESIVSQQLSVKAAATIWSRTHSVIDDWTNPSHILDADSELLRSVGMSYQKISYVKNIAGAVEDRSLPIHLLDEYDDEKVIEMLTAIKGIGRWTAEMFLIFTLCRPDIFSSGDLGLRNAIDKLYGYTRISPTEAKELSMKWSPYRSIASRILWKSLDTTT